MQHPGAYGASEVNSFVEAIAWIVVRVIKNSWGVYNEVLGDSRTASSFFEWCKEQVEGIPEDPLRACEAISLTVGLALNDDIRICGDIQTSVIWVSEG